MSFNVAGAVPVSLSVFGGLSTELAPDALPEGPSPDCQDVVFVPGSVSSRPCLQKVFAAPFPNDPTIPYGKSYVAPDGTIYNLYFDSNGVLWVENFTESPDVYVQLFQSTPGSYAKSVTAFGREYIAISDGLHGQEAPLQFDGTNLDRVTQDGPGAPPVISNTILPAVQMVPTGVPAVLTVTECDPAGITPGGAYTALNIFVTSLGSASPGQNILIGGCSNAALNGNYAITAVYAGGPPALIVAAAYFPPGTTFGTGGVGTLGSGHTISRVNNVASITTNVPHQLQPGFQVQITGMTAALVGGSITSIVINNESQPGIATVTTSAPHGLVPETFVTLTGINGGGGANISSLSRAGDTVTVVTATPHKLAPGSLVTISGTTPASFSTSTPVTQIVSATSFTFTQVDTDVTGSGGTVTLNWPIQNTATPNYYEIVAAPTATTFQIQLNYADGTWTGGTVSFAWNGTFFVATVLSPTSFTYQQYGPNLVTSQVGTVTPYGQAAPGVHQCQLLFLTRQGAITAGSPPVTFVANGGQYISASNIAIGPPNVVARILSFTGADGQTFFYIPVPAQVNGQFVSTATQINDNTSPSALLDFSDNSLYGALGISIPGNNVDNQIVLDSALGFGFYASRLLTYGQRNCIGNLLNMGFDGGYLPSLPTIPTGWTLAANSAGGSLAVGHIGQAWKISLTGGNANNGLIAQPAYQDAYGAPIAQPNTQYYFRAWVQVSSQHPDVEFVAQFSSSSLGYISAVAFFGTEMSLSGGWIEATLPLKTPATIPSDFVFQVLGKSSSTADAFILIDEMRVIYSQSPYLLGLYGSYINNPEGMDGVSGYFGPTDTRTVMDMGIIRNTLYLLTQDPSGRLHETNDNPTTEPAGWNVDQVAANCGSLSAFCVTHSQADDETGSGGEEWFSWGSSTGPRIFGGSRPQKIAQEIQPNWSGDATRGFLGLNFSAAKTIWSFNDTIARVIYFGVPSLDVAGPSNTPNLILPMNYRELDSAEAIADSPGARISNYSGKIIATDNSRKWTRWSLPMNGAAMMYRGYQLQPVFFCGNGAALGAANGFGNVYTLNAAKYTDDDYGQMFPYYVTYGFVSREQEAMLQLGSTRKQLAYVTAYITGIGNMTLSYLVNRLNKVWPLNSVRIMSFTPIGDMNFAGGNVNGERIFLKFLPVPATGTDVYFNMSKCMAAMRPAGRLPISGVA